jgi:hemerythrin-like domain-containing protein
MSEEPQGSDLFSRGGLPDDLLALARAYPRVRWPDHPRLGPLAQFWLGRHAMFRQLSKALSQAADAVRDENADMRAFQGWYAPRLRFFVQQLVGHHQVEDVRYFPLLMRVEPRLTRGFEILEGDHAAIHRSLADLRVAWLDLQRALREEPLEAAGAVDRMASDLGAFLAPLERHLDDEEDLIVPLILDRGEADLGLA